MKWRQNLGLAAEATIASLVLVPRCTFFVLHFSHGQRPIMPLLGAGVESPINVTSASFPDILELCLQVALPHVHYSMALAPHARDSFWWVFAIIFAVLNQLMNEVDMLRRLVRDPTRILHELTIIIRDMVIASAVISVLFATYALRIHGHEQVPLGLNLLLAFHAVKAAVRPWIEFDSRRHKPQSYIHFALMLYLLNKSDNFEFDVVTFALVTGPGASLTKTVLGYIYVRRRAKTLAPVVVVERGRFLATSIRQLSRLDAKKLRAQPYIIYTDVGLVAGAEEGIDFGGLRRDWLGRLICELFDPAAGLMEQASLDGTLFARLRPGGDLRQLEALGKALGIALRDGNPPGIDFCAPQAHMLVHPRLPEALAAIEPTSARAPQRAPWSARARVGKGTKELQDLGFSREWLLWVSCEEYDFWNASLLDPARGRQEAAQHLYHGDALPQDFSAPAVLADHMRQRALRTLVLDVKEELKALWRGLHTVPNVPLPSLSVEARGSKRRRGGLETLDAELLKADERAAKRARTRELDHAVPRDAAPIAGLAQSSLQAECRASSGQPCGAVEEPVTRTALAKEFSKGIFEQSVLQALLAGSSDVPLARWKDLTECAPPSRVNTPEGSRTIKWFWTHVEGLQPHERMALLEWITGFKRMPRTGFPPPYTRITLYLTEQSSQHLPCAHTCSLQIDLPRYYESESMLRERLTRASACMDFHIA